MVRLTRMFPCAPSIQRSLVSHWRTVPSSEPLHTTPGLQGGTGCIYIFKYLRICVFVYLRPPHLSPATARRLSLPLWALTALRTVVEGRSSRQRRWSPAPEASRPLKSKHQDNLLFQDD